MKNNYCYLNGKIFPESKAIINIYDIGFLRGFGVFDFLRTYGGRAFLLNEHINRLLNSAKLMSIKCPLDKEKIKEIIQKLLIKNNIGESTVRLILTGGISTDGISPGKNPTLLIVSRNLKNIPQKLYNKGVKLSTNEYQRFIPSAKHLNYSNLIRQKKKLEVEDAFNLLYISRGLVLEAAIYNFFIIKNNVLITPKKNILHGTVRNLVIKLAEKKYKVEERDISVGELGKTDEAFITGTTQGIVPVVKINNDKVGKGIPGSITNELIKIYKKYTLDFSIT